MRAAVSFVWVILIAAAGVLLLNACTISDDANTATYQETISEVWSQAEIFTVAGSNADNNISSETASAAKSEADESGFQAQKVIGEALNVYSLFISSAPKFDRTNAYDYDGVVYYKVTDSSLDTMAKLTEYISDYFSEEIVQSLVNIGRYIEVDGCLYTIDVSNSTAFAIVGEKYKTVDRSDSAEHYEVEVLQDNNADGKADSKETYKFVREKIDGKFVFTRFPYYK